MCLAPFDGWTPVELLIRKDVSFIFTGQHLSDYKLNDMGEQYDGQSGCGITLYAHDICSYQRLGLVLLMT